MDLTRRSPETSEARIISLSTNGEHTSHYDFVMKILEWGFPFGSGHGGREIFISRLSNSLAAAGHEVHLFHDSAVTFSDVLFNTHLFDPEQLTTSIGTLVKAIQDISPDVIHYHNAHDRSLLILHTYLRKYPTPTFLTLHDIASVAVANPIASITSKVIVPSQYMAERVGQTISPLVIPNSVPQIRGSDGPVQVLFAGHLTLHKGLIQLISAWQSIKSRDAAVKLLIAGDGPDQPVVARLAAGDSSISLLGWQSESEIRALLGPDTIVVIPSILPEAFGLIAAEAAMAGSSVVASDAGALKEVVLNEETGLVVPPSSAPHLATAIERLLADATLRKRLGAQARVRAQIEYGEKLAVDRYANLFAKSF